MWLCLNCFEHESHHLCQVIKNIITKTSSFLWINNYYWEEGVIWHCLLIFFSVQVKSGTCYITGQWGRVQNKIKKPLTLTFYYLLFFVIKFVSLSWFLRLYHFYGLLLVWGGKVMSVDYILRSYFYIAFWLTSTFSQVALLKISKH